MFEAIGAAIFVLVVAFALWYCGMYLMYLLWNNKYARKARKDAIEAMINAKKISSNMKLSIVNLKTVTISEGDYLCTQ